MWGVFGIGHVHSLLGWAGPAKMAPMTETIQEITGETRVDYNALDNTTGGRLIQAAFAGVFTAVPDYVHSTPARVVSWVGIAAAFTGTVAAFNAFDEDPRNDLTATVERTSGTGSPAKTWGLLAGGAALLIGSIRLGIAVEKKMAEGLRRRGVKRPYTLLGAGGAALLFAATELEARSTTA